MTIIEPIHVATINGKPLRFFRSPLTERLDAVVSKQLYDEIVLLGPPPDLPWHSVNDLMLCMGLPRGLRERRQRDYASQRQQTIQYEDATPLDLHHTRTIATEDGITLIAPDIMALGMIRALEEDGSLISYVFQSEYGTASRQALDKLTAGMSPSHLLRWLKIGCVRYEPGYFYRAKLHRESNPHLYSNSDTSPAWWDDYKALEREAPLYSGCLDSKASYLSWLQAKWAAADTANKQQALREYWRITGDTRCHLGITYRDAAKLEGFIPDIADYVDEVAS
jgi:hypothetical protein